MFQNTYTNADKLLEAAEQLAQTGECDPEEIYQAAHQLEDRIQDFVRRVEQRKVLLDMSVAFHTHVKEVCRSPFPTIISQFFPTDWFKVKAYRTNIIWKCCKGRHWFIDVTPAFHHVTFWSVLLLISHLLL